MEWFTSLPGIDELDTAEAFFDYFELPADPAVIRAKRLHIMHEFHRRLAQVISVPLAGLAPGDAGELARNKARWSMARHLLDQSYRHFLQGELAATSAMAIYQRHKASFIPWSALMEVLP